MSIRPLMPVIIAFQNETENPLRTHITPLSSTGNSNFKCIASDGSSQVDKIHVENGMLTSIFSNSILGIKKQIRSLILEVDPKCRGQVFVPNVKGIMFRVTNDMSLKDTIIILKCSHESGESAFARISFWNHDHVTVEEVNNIDCSLEIVSFEEDCPPSDMFAFFTSFMSTE